MAVEVAEAVEAVQPGGIGPGAVADHRVPLQVFAQPDHDLAQIERAGLGRGDLGPIQIVLMARRRLAAPGEGVGRGQGRQGRGEPARRGHDPQGGAIEAADLVGVGMDMDQGHARVGKLEQAVFL